MSALFDTDDDSDSLPVWLSSAPPTSSARDAGLAQRLVEAPTAGGVRTSAAPQVAPTGSSGIFSPAAGAEGGTAPSNQPAYDGTTAAVAATGDARIDGILSGVRWNQSQITYAFPANASDYENNYPGNNPNEGFGQLTIAQQAVYHNALNSSNATTGPGGALFTSVEGFTNQDILFVLPTGNATMRAAYSTDPGSTAYAYYPSTDFYGGDAWYGTNSPRNYQAPVLGGDAYRSTFHEIGHQLGLKHGHETGGPGNTALPADYNSHEFSVMTYSSYIGVPAGTGYTNETYGHPQSWMMLDIAALQYMYGADFNHNGGDTTYTWSTTTGQMFVDGVGQGTPGANRIFLTIWDGNGIDTYNLSNYTSDLDIDLTPGGYSDFNSGQSAYLGGGPNNGYARGNVFNALQYQGDARSLIENAIGGSGDDSITGNDANNTLTGNGGNDSLYGLLGNDGLYGGSGDDYLKGGGGADLLSGGDDNDELKGGGDADTLIGGAGIDTASYADSDQGVDVTLDGSGYFGTAQGDTLTGIENLYGSAYADTLRGNAVANILNGAAGADTMAGYAGDDTYYVDNAGDVVLETTGNDTILATASYVLAAGQSVETMAVQNAASTDAINLYGNELAQTLIGNAGSNTLDGRGGADTMRGLGGDDNYYVDNTGDVVIENAAEGQDWVRAILTTYTLGANVENLDYLGVSTSNFTGYGNELNNIIQGWNGNDILDGRAGADTMRGYDGDDTFYVDNAGDLVIELAGYGNDRISTSVSYTLAAGQSVEALYFSNAASVSPLNLTGNEVAQSLTGNAGDNILFGGGGADAMHGLGGNDAYSVDNAGDLVFEAAGAGTDRISASVSYTLAAGQSVETLYLSNAAAVSALNLTGNEVAQSLTGNAGDNILIGGGGADTMHGLGGNDTYSVDNVGDQVFEAAGAGTDRVSSAVSYTLAAGQSIEALYLNNPAAVWALNLVGNEQSQSLTGNAGDNILIGGGGVDTMYGLGGNDTYSVDSATDLVFEAAGGGTDRVSSAVSYTLAAGQSIEALYLNIPTAVWALNLTGNELAQSLTGNAGDNILIGGGGADTMRGLGGNDTYSVDNAGDLVFETAGAGTDRVSSSVSYGIGAGQSIEALYLSNAAAVTALNLTGNEVAQSLTGNAGNNVLDGKGGIDTLRGLGGNDSFSFSTALGAGNIDHIADFVAADDNIRLDQTIFSALSLGALASTAYKDIASGTVDADDRILYDHNTGQLFYDSNGSGAGGRVEFAVLDNKPAVLTNIDFFVVA